MESKLRDVGEVIANVKKGELPQRSPEEKLAIAIKKYEDVKIKLEQV